MANYGKQKRRILDRITSRSNAQFKRIIKADLEKKKDQIFSSLESGNFNIRNLDFSEVDRQIDRVLQEHQLLSVRTAVSDGIQEVTPNNDLGLWTMLPDDHDPLITLPAISRQLQSVSDKVVEKFLREAQQLNTFDISALRRTFLSSYLNIIQKGHRELAKEWIVGKSSIKKVVEEISTLFDRSQNDAMRIFRTETTNYFNSARADYFQTQTDMDYMQIFAITDGRTSQICEDRDGWVFPIAEATQKSKKPAFHPHCYDDITEVYTDKGWQLFKDVEIGQKCLSLIPETNDLEWTKVINKQQYKHKGKINLFTNNQNSLSLCVTDDHTMFYSKRHYNNTFSNKFSNINEFNSSKNNKIYCSSNWQGKDKKHIEINGLKLSTENFCKFMAYYLSDGNIRKGSVNTRYIGIARVNNKEMYEEIKKMGFKNVTKTKEKIHIYDSRVGEYCRQFGYSYQKYIPEIIKTLSKKYLDIFLDAYAKCDGHQKKGKLFKGHQFNDSYSYFTCSHRLMSDLTEIIIKSGHSCSVVKRNDKGKEHTFKNGTYILNHDLYIINKLNSKRRSALIKKQIDYDGYVYDLSVDKHHTLLVKRDGRISWGSNCRTVQRPLTSRLASHRRLIDKGLAMNESQFTPLPRGWA